jgi:hypothetical protein
MRVLFYGGCHAAALRRIFERFGHGLTHVDHLTNFRLIRKQLPVPYEQFLGFDAVVFSPIRNKAEYNTSHLEEFLSSKGVRFIKFPWLQWEGYFPGMSRASFPWYSGWWPTRLDHASEQFGSFEEFRDAVYAGTVLQEEARQNFAVTTEKLRLGEEGCDVRVVDFIVENHRHQRLFLTPDHAGIALYKHVAAQIAERLGCALDPAFAESTIETQAGISFPVLPAVRQALDIRFPGGEFECNLFFGTTKLSMTEYLHMVYHRKRLVAAQTVANTRIYPVPGAQAAAGPGTGIQAKLGTTLLLETTDQPREKGFGTFRIVAMHRGSPQTAALGMKLVRLYHRHWSLGQAVEGVEPEDEKTDLDGPLIAAAGVP